jgi:hypothetical protein
MTCIVGSNIPKNGLKLHLDPANRKCFKSGDTTCKNLVTSGSVTGASNFPVYTDGFFDFAPASSGMNVVENLGVTTDVTQNYWLYKNSSNQDQYISDARNTSLNQTWFLANYAGYNLNYRSVSVYNFSPTYNTSDTNFINKWVFVTATANSSGTKLYVNGVEVETGSATIGNAIGTNFRIGNRYTTSNYWTGYMGNILIYDRVLSPDEIYQIYDNTKGKYI